VVAIGGRSRCGRSQGGKSDERTQRLASLGKISGMEETVRTQDSLDIGNTAVAGGLGSDEKMTRQRDDTHGDGGK